MGMLINLDLVKGGVVKINPLSVDAVREDPYQDESASNADNLFGKGKGSMIHLRSGQEFQVKHTPDQVEFIMDKWMEEQLDPDFDVDDDDEPYTGAMPEDQG